MRASPSSRSASDVVSGGVTCSRLKWVNGQYRYLFAYSIVPPQIQAGQELSGEGKVSVSGIGISRSANGVVTVVDEDQSNEVAMSSFTTRSDGFFFQVG